MKTKEGAVKDRVKAIIKSHTGAWYFMPVSNGFGVHGVPDFLICFKGLFITVETKAGNNQPTTRQRLIMDKIWDAGGLTLVINEDNLDDLKKVMDKIARLPELWRDYV